MNVIESTGTVIGFTFAVLIFSIIISFIRGNMTVKPILLIAVSTAVLVLILAGLFRVSEKRKVEDVS